MFLIRHKNLSGPDFTPRQLPGNHQPRLDDGPVSTSNGVQAHFRSFSSVCLPRALLVFFRPAFKVARPSFAVFFSSGCGRALRVLRASFPGLFGAPFPPSPSSLFPTFRTFHDNPPFFPPSFPRPSSPQSVGTLTGVFAIYHYCIFYAENVGEKL